METVPKVLWIAKNPEVAFSFWGSLTIGHCICSTIISDDCDSRYLSWRIKVRIFGSLVMPVLLYSCEAWTLTAQSEKATGLVLDYSWQDRVSNQEMLRRAGMSRVTCLIRERQLRFDGYVVRSPMDDPAHRILNAKDPVEWNRRRGRPNSSWLAQLGDHMKE